MLIKKIPDTNGLVTATILNAKISKVENKIPNICSLMTTTVLSTKISQVENKIPDHAKQTTNQEFDKLTGESFAARLKQANVVNKTNFDNKLISFSKKKYFK